MSLEIIRSLAPSPDAAIVDVGGGASWLAAALLDQGFQDLTVLDVSPAALEVSQAQLGPLAPRVNWLRQDVLLWSPARSYQLWHDRAVFHFLVDPRSRARYVEALERGLGKGGRLILGVFAPDGPSQCSGLPVARFDAAGLAAELGPGFAPLNAWTEQHATPDGGCQAFTWAAFQRRD